MFAKRIDKVREKNFSAKLDSLLIFSLANLYYLSGFTGSAAIGLITANNAYLFTDFRYQTQAKREVKGGFKLKIVSKPWEALIKLINSLRGKRIGFEAEYLDYFRFSFLKKRTKKKIIPCRGMVEGLRLIKDPEEISLIRRAITIYSRVFSSLPELIRPGIKEERLAAQLEYKLRLAGVQRLAFDLIIASGARAAEPHGKASAKKICRGETLIIDGGINYRGYCCDVTRTYIIGKSVRRQRALFNLLLAAQEKAIESIKPGIAAQRVDRAAREIIIKAGYGDYFKHGTGHGVGIDVHEAPSISRGEKLILEPGMIFTLEPGIYIPGWGGIRIEDMVLVTSQGCQVLTEKIGKGFRVI